MMDYNEKANTPFPPVVDILDPVEVSHLRCGLNGGGVALLQKVCSCADDRFLLAVCRRQSSPSSLQIKMKNSQLLQHHVCLHAAMLPAMMIMDRTSETVRPSQLSIFFYKSCHGHGVFSQQWNPN